MDELVELLWERGTVVVQGQSSRPLSADTGTGYSYKAPSFGDGAVLAAHEIKEVKKMLINKDAAGGNPAQMMQFDDSPEPLLDPEFFSLPGTEPMDRPECDVRVAADVDADADTGRVPWIDYPILDSSSDHHCTGTKAGDQLPPSNLINSDPPLPPPPASLPPKTADVREAVPVHEPRQDINNVSCSVKKPPHLHLEGGGLGVGLVNFSHFLRPVALAEATLQSAERLRSNEKASTSYNNSSRLESIVIQSASTLPPLAKPSALPKPQMLLPSIHQKEVAANGTSNHYRDGNNQATTPPSLQPAAQRAELDREKERQKAKEREKNVQQPEAAPASVCSINVDPKQKLKRKSLEEDNATNSDEDVQDESVGLTRSSTSKSKGIKRGRTAEVHNLSERRRRDRINEKMRALQELIPNCNKVDKASMLDEAIEYLKTLQLQVQMMMMMGNGMCIPPMMVPPPGLHHMPLAAYPQMGMGMGISMGMNMGMGYGIGMAAPAVAGDINHHHPVIRTPHLAPSMNFMPVINGAVFPFDNGIPPPAPTSFGPQVERRHGNSSNPAQSGEVGVNRTDTGNNGETVKSTTRSWS